MADLTNIITIIGIVQGLFILVLVLPKAKKDQSARYASLLLLVFITDLTLYLILNLRLFAKLWMLIGIGEVTLFMYGPVLYFYVKSLLDKEKSKNNWKQYLHFVPALIVWILLSPLLLRNITVTTLAELKRETLLSHFHVEEFLFDFALWYLHVVIYFTLCLRLLRKVIGNLRENIQVNTNHIKWVKALLVGYLAFALINASGYALDPFFDLKPYSYQVLNAFMVFHVFGISYIGYTNQNLLLTPAQIIKYGKSTLSKEKQQEYLNVLKEYFSRDKPYLDQELTLGKVASQLNIPSNHLSQVINHAFGHGFNDFSNAYRVDLAKELIVKPDMNKFTLEAIANEVGFKSKSSFNSAFKKKCGMTPSDFRKQAQ